MRPDLFSAVSSFDDARRRIMAGAHPIERTENVDLQNADGRVVAHDVLSPLDVPAFDRAAMDGYAVRAVDVTTASETSPARLRLGGAIYTGDAPGQVVSEGACLAIATGAPVPDGADAVVMVEQTARQGADVLVRTRVTAGQNIGRRASDLARGDTVVRAGVELSPAGVGSLAAAGFSTVEVYARPTIALLSTGNEITPPGQPLPRGHVYDVNRFTVGALVERHGGVSVPMPAAGDTIDELTAALDQAAPHDIIVFSGGSSVGARDLMLDALERRGSIELHGVAIKPGKPMLFGWIGGTPIFGMPGNPASCLTNAYVLLVPFLRVIARRPVWVPTVVRAPLARRVTSTAGRHQFYPVRLRDALVEPVFKSSGDITSLARAQGFFEIPEEVTSVDEGTIVEVKMF